MMVHFRASVYDAGPEMNHHWANVTYELGSTSILVVRHLFLFASPEQVRWSNAVSIPGQHFKRWPNIETLQRVLFAWTVLSGDRLIFWLQVVSVAEQTALSARLHTKEERWSIIMANQCWLKLVQRRRWRNIRYPYVITLREGALKIKVSLNLSHNNTDSNGNLIISLSYLTSNIKLIQLQFPYTLGHQTAYQH